MVLVLIVDTIWGRQSSDILRNIGSIIWAILVYGGAIVIALASPVKYVRAVAANGSLPQENARRRKEHDDAVAASIRDAEPRKAAEDHRLRIQIRELESLTKTVSAKETAVRDLLKSL